MVRVKEAGLLDHEHASDYQRMIHGLIRDSLSYERYWQDIDAALEGIDHVYFSPDGVYHKVNPATLFDMDEQVYVIEKYGMTLLTNPIDLAHRQAPAPGLMTASLYGNPDYTFVPDGFEQETSRGNSIEYTSLSPLPGTKVEVQNITDVLVENGWEVSSWTGHQATEAQLKSEDSPRLLHIATHGFFLPEMNVSADMVFGIRSDRSWANPLLRSGLMLASATANIISQQLDDGIFTAFEAASMDLTQTELVVLSACETGLGEVRDEQGVYGLQRAFLMAGADNLMMSLWQVADQPTQKLMSEFYAAWASGTPMADAFRDAQLELMKTHPEPIYWGAFVHVQR